MKILVKRDDNSRFLYETSTETPIKDLKESLNAIYNGQLMVERLCEEMRGLAEHGACLPADYQGMSAEELEEIHFQDDYTPIGGFKIVPDPVGKRNGKAPSDEMKEVLMKTVCECEAKISKKAVEADVCLTLAHIDDCLSMLKGAVSIVYPTGLPNYDPISKELEGDLKGQATHTETADKFLSGDIYQLWWAGKEMQTGKKLSDYVGNNEKTKIIAKLQKEGLGPPSREPAMSEEEQKLMMSIMYKRQEELRKLEDDDDFHLDSEWADSKMLKLACQGVKGIRFGPK